jgi:hypothetical protein
MAVSWIKPGQAGGPGSPGGLMACPVAGPTQDALGGLNASQGQLDRVPRVRLELESPDRSQVIKEFLVGQDLPIV